MRLWYNNLIDAAGVAFSFGSVTAGYPVSNIAHEFKTKVYRTAAPQITEHIDMDLGAALPVTSAIIFAHNLVSGDTGIILKFSDDNFTTTTNAGTFTQTSGAMVLTFATVTHRYWRIQFDKATASTRDVGRVYIGTYYDTPDRPDWNGMPIVQTDLSVQHRSVGGQLYTNRRSQYRNITATFSGVSDQAAADAKTIIDTVGIATPMFVQHIPGDTGEPGEVLYVKMDGTQNGAARTPAGPDWDLIFNFVELL